MKYKWTPETTQELKDRCLSALSACKSDIEQFQDLCEDYMDAYFSKELGNEVSGRSKVVMSDVFDTVESIMPSLMRIFYGSKNIITVDPVGREDEAKARLMSEKVNYDLTVANAGFSILNDWCKDALINGFGVIKYHWKKDKVRTSKSYKDLNEFEYQKLQERVASGDFEIASVEEEVTEIVQTDVWGISTVTQQISYDVEGYVVEESSSPCIENVPIEEFIFPITSKSISDCGFVAHKKRVHKSELAKYGVQQEDITDEVSSFRTDSLYLERFESLGGISFITDEYDNPDFVYIYECYVYEYDKEGRKNSVKVTILGNKVIDIEDNTYNRPPFCVLTPITVPHRMVGLGIGEIAKQLQNIHTMLFRFILDNIAFSNNGRVVVNPFRINMDDYLNNNVPGGAVRTKFDIEPSSAIHSIAPPPIAQQIFPMLEMLEQVRETRTGVTKYQQGTDPRALNRTATGVSIISSFAQQRVEQIARIFAETGFRDLANALVQMNLSFFDKSISLRLNEKWVDVSPLDIDGKFDVIVDVGASTGVAETRVNQMIQMLNTYGLINQLGAPIPAKYVYNITREIWSQWGYKNVDSFAPLPEQVPEDMMQQQAIMAQMQQATMQMMGGINGGQVPMGQGEGMPGPQQQGSF